MTKLTKAQEKRLPKETVELVRSIYTKKQADIYLETLILRNEGLTFREIAKKREVNVSAAHNGYLRVIGLFKAIKKYNKQYEK